MLRSLTLGLFVATLTVAAGCAVGPDYHRPDTAVPTAFDSGGTVPATQPATIPTVTAQPAPLQEWWTALADPELNTLVERAIHSNLDLAIALARLGEARSQRYVVAADVWPGVGFSAAAANSTGTDATRSRLSPALNSSTDTTRVKRVTEAGGFDASWEVDLWGHVARQVEAATADVQAAAEARNQVLVSVIADVVRAYAHLRATQERLQISQRNVRVQERLLAYVRRRLELGLGDKLDLALAQRQTEAARSVIAPLQAEVTASERLIAVLLGADPQALYTELDRVGADPQALYSGLDRAVDLAAPPPATVALGQPEDLLRHRPDVREAERQLAAATARIGVAAANFFPQISLSGAIGLQGQGLRTSPADDRLIYSLGPSVRWPILDFGRLDAAMQVQDWRTRQALLTYRKIVQQAIQEVDDALGLFAAQQDRYQRLRAAVSASDQAERLAADRYDRGLTDFLNVLDAQRQLYDLEDQAAASQEAVAVNWTALNKALGRGWEAPDLPSILPAKPPAVLPPVKAVRSVVQRAQTP